MAAKGLNAFPYPLKAVNFIRMRGNEKSFGVLIVGYFIYNSFGGLEKTYQFSRFGINFVKPPVIGADKNISFNYER